MTRIVVSMFLNGGCVCVHTHNCITSSLLEGRWFLRICGIIFSQRLLWLYYTLLALAVKAKHISLEYYELNLLLWYWTCRTSRLGFSSLSQCRRPSGVWELRVPSLKNTVTQHHSGRWWTVAPPQSRTGRLEDSVWCWWRCRSCDSCFSSAAYFHSLIRVWWKPAAARSTLICIKSSWIQTLSVRSVRSPAVYFNASYPTQLLKCKSKYFPVGFKGLICTFKPWSVVQYPLLP